MSKFLHRDAIHEPGAPSEFAFGAAERLGIRWPALPWTCPGCGHTFDDHKETIATIDLELAVSLAEILRATPTMAAFLCIVCDVANHMAPIVVHVLFHGVTLCGIRDLPTGHRWVTRGEGEVATCLLCKQLSSEG